MANKSGYFTDSEGNHLLGATLGENVFLSDGTDLETKLNNMNNHPFTKISATSDTAVPKNTNVTFYNFSLSKGVYFIHFEVLWKPSGQASGLSVGLASGGSDISYEIESGSGWTVQTITLPYVVEEATQSFNLYAYHNNNDSASVSVLRGYILKL